MPEDGKDLEQARPAPLPATIELSRGIRSACAIGGALIVAFAGVVLWRGQDGAATVAFVALAALLLILAVAGVVPRRIKSGAHEMDLTRESVNQAAIESADAALATMTPEEIKAYIDETLRQARAGDPTGTKIVTASRAQAAADFEAQADLALVYALNSAGYKPSDLTQGGPPGTGRPWKFAITLKNGQSVRFYLQWSIPMVLLEQLIDARRNIERAVEIIIMPTIRPQVRSSVSRVNLPSEQSRVVVVEPNPDLLRWVIRRLSGISNEPRPLGDLVATRNLNLV